MLLKIFYFLSSVFQVFSQEFGEDTVQVLKLTPHEGIKPRSKKQSKPIKIVVSAYIFLIFVTKGPQVVKWES